MESSIEDRGGPDPSGLPTSNALIPLLTLGSGAKDLLARQRDEEVVSAVSLEDEIYMHKTQTPSPPHRPCPRGMTRLSFALSPGVPSQNTGQRSIQGQGQEMCSGPSATVQGERDLTVACHHS